MATSCNEVMFPAHNRLMDKTLDNTLPPLILICCLRYFQRYIVFAEAANKVSRISSNRIEVFVLDPIIKVRMLHLLSIVHAAVLNVFQSEMCCRIVNPFTLIS